VTIDADALPRPSRVEWEDGTVRVQSNGWRSGGILRTRTPDPQLRPRRWSLIYERVHGAVAAALRAHFAEHGNTDFAWTPPGTSIAARVIYREPTTIDWDNATSASCRVFLEEVLAHD
jgi:hypothetical protein